MSAMTNERDFVVCPWCGGRAPEDCEYCLGEGFVPETELEEDYEDDE